MPICELCKHEYHIAWDAPDHIWQTISGHTDNSGLLCPTCFDTLARLKGVILIWHVANKPKEDMNNVIKKKEEEEQKIAPIDIKGQPINTMEGFKL